MGTEVIDSQKDQKGVKGQERGGGRKFEKEFGGIRVLWVPDPGGRVGFLGKVRERGRCVLREKEGVGTVKRGERGEKGRKCTNRNEKNLIGGAVTFCLAVVVKAWRMGGMEGT